MADSETISEVGSLPASSGDSMSDYYRLQRNLLVVTALLAAIVFSSVWIAYSLTIALNYLIGACVGILYLRMLSKNVEKLGRQQKRLGNTRLVPLIGLIIIASQWNQLQILPIFLGFLTYKAAVIVYVLQTSFSPDHSP